jgi:hypothetical protein
MFDWVPPLVLMRDAGNDWDIFLRVVYLMFKRDFIDHKVTFRGAELRLKRLPYRDGREATFYHLISEGEDEEIRQPIEDRCERIRWPRPVIENCPSDDLHIWENTRKGGRRIVIAFPDYSYVVILAVRSGYMLPWTAYPANRRHTREKLRKEHQAFLKEAGAAI